MSQLSLQGKLYLLFSIGYFAMGAAHMYLLWAILKHLKSLR